MNAPAAAASCSDKLRHKIKVSGLPRFYSLLVSSFDRFSVCTKHGA